MSGIGLAAQIEEAEARVALLRRQALAATCSEIGRHDWKHIGGKNAGCDELCGCSVPVYECARCGDCDYGDNAEARDVRASCVADDTIGEAHAFVAALDKGGER